MIVKTKVMKQLKDYEIYVFDAIKHHEELGIDYECGNGGLINFIDHEESEQLMDREEAKARELYEEIRQ